MTHVEKADLQGTGNPVRVIVLRDESLRPGLTRAPRGVSDEIRVYEPDDGELKLVLDFQPEPEPYIDPLAPEVVNSPIYTFNVSSTRDLDSNGRPELIGAFSQRGMQDVKPMPVAILFKDSTQRFRIVPLLNVKPDLPPVSPSELYAHTQQEDYLEPLQLSDPTSATTVEGFRVEGYTLGKTPNGGYPALIVGYLTHGTSHASTDLRLGAKLVLMDFHGARAVSYPCGVADPPGEPLVPVPPRFGGGYAEVDTTRALSQAYRAVRSRFSC